MRAGFCEGGEVNLGGRTLYTTCEPCPMCFTAAWLARVSRLVIGCIMTDVQEAARGRRRELTIPAAEMARLARGSMLLVNGVLATDYLARFQHQPR